MAGEVLLRLHVQVAQKLVGALVMSFAPGHKPSEKVRGTGRLRFRGKAADESALPGEWVRAAVVGVGHEGVADQALILGIQIEAGSGRKDTLPPDERVLNRTSEAGVCKEVSVDAIRSRLLSPRNAHLVGFIQEEVLLAFDALEGGEGIEGVGDLVPAVGNFEVLVELGNLLSCFSVDCNVISIATDASDIVRSGILVLWGELRRLAGLQVRSDAKVFALDIVISVEGSEGRSEEILVDRNVYKLLGCHQ